MLSHFLGFSFKQNIKSIIRHNRHDDVSICVSD